MNGYAAITDGKGHFSIEPITIGAPAAKEVLVQIKASGVCHTDYDSQSWGERMIMGHEGAGVVLAVGSDVTTVQVNDRVLLNWAIPCGNCFQCSNGEQSICERQFSDSISPELAGHPHPESIQSQGAPLMRSFRLGTMATHAIVREEALVRIDVDIPFSSACIIGCGVMTGYGSVVNAAKVTAGNSVVVLGAGGVGLNVIQGARISGAEKIIAIDVQPSKLDWAKQFGATDTILAEKSDSELLAAAEKVKEMTGGRGADYAFECTAIPQLGAAPLAMVRNGGTAVQVSGIEEKITVDMTLFEWDKIYINPLYGKCRPQIDLPILLNLYQKNLLMLDELVTNTYRLDELEKAFADMHAGKNAKGVLLIDE